MITPKAVSAERSLFRRKAPKAVRQVGGKSEGIPGFARGAILWPCGDGAAETAAVAAAGATTGSATATAGAPEA
jgi:hypothetical protein